MENILFRCSSLGYIMTEPQKKSEPLSETCITHLIDKFISIKYKRNTDIQSRYTTKGLMVEEDSITLYSLHKKSFFKKNDTWLTDEFISGTPDLYEGEEIKKATRIIDVKSSWDIFTFFRTKNKPVNKNYYWQLQGYMALTGAKSATLAYCLVDTPHPLIQDEKRKLMWKMGVATDQNPDFIEACKEIDKLSIYEDIPMGERVLETVIERNDSDIERLYERAKVCKDYIQKLLDKCNTTS